MCAKIIFQIGKTKIIEEFQKGKERTKDWSKGYIYIYIYIYI